MDKSQTDRRRERQGKMESGMKVEVWEEGCRWLYLTHRFMVMRREWVRSFAVPPVSALKWEKNKDLEVTDYHRKQ